MRAAPDPPARREELAGALSAVESRIEAACARSGRRRGDVTLVVVTKFFPVSDVELLVELGVAHVGESRDQEARAKLAAVAPGLREHLAVHFVGQVQTRKASSVARYADVVHSVDRPPLAQALSRAASRCGRTLDVLVQVSLEAREGRGGVPVPEALALADVVAHLAGLRLRGVMAIAPQGGPARPAFVRLGEVASRIRQDHPQASWVSAGMSGDLETAVECGATHLRVGSAILGSRPRPR